MTTVFVVDDHEVVRGGVCALIDAEPELEVVGEAASVQQALARIPATTPQVAVLDVQLPDGSGIDMCRAIRSDHPEVRCLMFTAYDDDRASYAAVLAGASGYVKRDIRGNHLIDSIRRVAAGESLVDASVTRGVLSSLQPAAGAALLTARELTVLGLITDGLTNRQIGEELELAEKTVKNYISGLFAKLGMERRTQAAVFGATLRQNPSKLTAAG